MQNIQRLVIAAAIAAIATSAHAQHWIRTWAAAPQHWTPGRLQTFQVQTLRLIVHTSAGGTKVRIAISNHYGDLPLAIGAAHIARRATGSDIVAESDRAVTFGGSKTVTIAPHASVLSDAADLDVPALSDLAVSLYFPGTAFATTSHVLAKQTSYVTAGDATADVSLPAAKPIATWPFLVGVDVVAEHGATVVALGSSLTDGDGSTKDANRRWPDVLAERLRTCNGETLGIANEGIIGNRLMSDFDTPRQSGGPFGPVYQDLGPALGDAGVRRFDRDVLGQPGVRYVVLALGVNDILFPGSFTPASGAVTAQQIIDANRQLLARAHAKGVRAIITTIPGFKGSVFLGPKIEFFTPENEKVRQEVNAWIRSTREFDGMIDFDAPVRDPADPAKIRADFDSGDHLHPNDAGYVATGNIVPLQIFGCP